VGGHVGSRLIDWIWHVRGSLPLGSGLSSDEAFDRLAPLFKVGGTDHLRSGDTLTFTKKDQAAQDKMSVYDGGTLTVDRSAAGPVLRYHLTSRALLFCFLAPLFFLAIAQMTVALGKLEKPSSEETDKSAKKDDKKEADVPMNAIDKFLGAPEPEKKDEKKDKEKAKDKDKGPSPTPAYVFACIFAVLYVVGRILEPWLIRSAFRKHLADPMPDVHELPAA